MFGSEVGFSVGDVGANVDCTVDSDGCAVGFEVGREGAPSEAAHQPAFWASRAHAAPTQGRAPLESFPGTRSRPPLAPKCRLSIFQTPCRFEASLPGCLAPFPQLSALVARVKARPRIAAYLTSDRYARTDKFGPL